MKAPGQATTDAGASADGPPDTLAYAVECSLTRWGKWIKKLALVGLVHRSLGDLGLVKSAGLFAFSTFWSTWKILHDYHPPRGTRLYVANLCGDDAAVKRIREFPDTHASWDTCNEFLMSHHQDILSKAMAAGWCSFSRNLKNGTLYLYWTYSYLKVGFFAHYATRRTKLLLLPAKLLLPAPCTKP